MVWKIKFKSASLGQVIFKVVGVGHCHALCVNLEVFGDAPEGVPGDLKWFSPAVATSLGPSSRERRKNIFLPSLGLCFRSLAGLHGTLPVHP